MANARAPFPHLTRSRRSVRTVRFNSCCSRKSPRKSSRAKSNSLCFVFLPPGVKVVQAASASCQDFCGYHEGTSDNIFYAVMPYPVVRGAGASPSPTRSLPPARTNFAKQSRIQCPGKDGTTTATRDRRHLAWKTRVLGGYTFNWNGRTTPDRASELRIVLLRAELRAEIFLEAAIILPLKSRSASQSASFAALECYAHQQ